MTVLPALTVGILLLIKVANAPVIVQPLTDVEVAAGENATFTADVKGESSVAWKFNDTYLFQLPPEVIEDIHFREDVYTLIILGRPEYDGLKVGYEAWDDGEQVNSEAYMWVTEPSVPGPSPQPTDTPTSGGTDTGAGDSSSPTASGATDDPTEGSTGRPTEDPPSTTSDPTISDGTLAALIVSSVVVIGILTCMGVTLCVWKRQWIRRKIQPYLHCLQPSELNSPIQETTPPPSVDGPAESTQKTGDAVPASSASPHDSEKVYLEEDSDSNSAQSVGKKSRRQNGGPSVQLSRSEPSAEVETNDVAVPSPPQVMPGASSLQSSSNLTEKDRDDEPPTDEHDHPVSKGMEAVPCDGAELEGVMVV